MNSLLIVSVIVLFLLFVIAYIYNLVFKVYSDKFYRIFHFLGGGFSFLFFWSLTKLVFLSFFFVLLISILWEIHEWVMWKFVFKKKALKPGEKDTLDDLFLDMIGAFVFYLLTMLARSQLNL